MVMKITEQVFFDTIVCNKMKNCIQKSLHLMIGAFLSFSILIMFKVNTYAKSDEYEYAGHSSGEGICLTDYKGSDEIVYIPDSMEMIGYQAFCESGLEQITIPSGVKSIQSSAFEESKLCYFP